MTETIFKVLSIDEINKLSDDELELKINEVIKLYGDNHVDHFRLNIEFLNISIDGRICADEFEELDKPAPCCVDYIGVSSDSNYPYFHMYSTFSKHFPLASNDKYNLSVLDRNILEKLYFAFAKEKILSTYELKEYNRTKLNTQAKKLAVFQSIHSEYEFKIVENPKLLPHYFNYTDFNHFVDCVYCCFNIVRDLPNLNNAIEYFKSNNIEYPYHDVSSLKQHIISSVANNKNLAIALKILYPTYNMMKSSYYLAGQTKARYLRWRTLIPYVYDEIDKHITDEQLEKLLLDNIAINEFLSIEPFKIIDDAE